MIQRPPSSGRKQNHLWFAGLAVLLGLPMSLVGAERATQEKQLELMLSRFPAADSNKDGKLTIDEFRVFRGKTRAGGTPTLPGKSVEHFPAPPAASPNATRVAIEITSEHSMTINPKIYGINCAEMFIFDLVQKPEYIAALGELQFNTFLFPGGSSYHHPSGSGGFNMSQEEIAKSRHGTEHRANKVGSPDFFEQYVGFIKPMGGHAVFIPNVANGTVAELDYYLKKMTEARVPIDCVVLGMEVQLGAFRFETSAAYVTAITPYVEYLKAKYPGVRIGAWSTPVGRKASVPSSYRQWNKDVAKVPGIDGFAQYGWTEFGGGPMRGRDSEASTPATRLKQYDAFVEHFPKQQIDVYAEDWGNKKMFMLQWGTHADRNLVVEGLHSVNFLFFMTSYNASHDNYFEAATWSVPIMQDLTTGKRKNSGGGVTYKKDIALWSPYLYVKPLRTFYSGDKKLLASSATGGGKDGEMELVKTLAATGPDGHKYLCVLNRGPARALGELKVDGRAISDSTSVRVESVCGDSLSTTGAALKTFVGEQTIGTITIEPYSVTTMILP